MIFRFCKEQLIDVNYPHNLKLLKYNLPYLFYLYLPKTLAILFIPIIKYKTEGRSHEANTISKNYHIVTIEKNKKKMFLLIYIISLLEVIQENGDLLLYYYERIGPIKWLVEKKSGLIIFFIGAFIINFCRFPLGFSTLEDFPFHLLNIFFSFVLSLAFVLIKYVMINFIIISPYLYLFYNGIFNIINSFIYLLLEYVIVINLPDHFEEEKNIHPDYFANNYLGIFTIFKGQEKNFYIYFCIIFILLFVYYIINALTIFNFNLYLIIIVETCLPIDTDMIEIFYKDDVFNAGNILTRVLFQCIGYIIIIISALILNEILILNFLGFNKNIRLNITSRSELDVEGSFTLRKDTKEIELEEGNFNETDNEL